MINSLTDVRELAKSCCESCGRPLDLRCEDCGCPVSCHDVIDPKDSGRVPYCMWDFGPCLKERRPAFLAAIEAWLQEATGRLT
jgi:predicted amidophosphoribosyltransferase